MEFLINHNNFFLVITPTRSTTDMPNTVGNTARRDNGSLLYPEPEEHPVESQAYQQHPYSQQRLCWWESNYKEASIFLEVMAAFDKYRSKNVTCFFLFALQKTLVKNLTKKEGVCPS